MSRRKDASRGATDIRGDASQPPPEGQVQCTDGPAPWTAFADALPPALRPAAVMLIGIARAAAPLSRAGLTATRKLGHAGWALIALFLPLLVWMGSKWVQWYVMSYVKKAQRVLSWAVWLLGLMPKGSAGAAGA